MKCVYENGVTNPEYAGHFSFQVPEGFVPNAVALNCGVYDLPEAMKGNEQMRQLMRDYLGKVNYEEKLALSNPMIHINSFFPPAYIMTSNKDFLKGQAPLLKDKLEKLKIKYAYKVYGDEQSNLGHVFHCNIRIPESEQCNSEECRFLAQF